MNKMSRTVKGGTQKLAPLQKTVGVAKPTEYIFFIIKYFFLEIIQDLKVSN